MVIINIYIIVFGTANAKFLCTPVHEAQSCCAPRRTLGTGVGGAGCAPPPSSAAQTLWHRHLERIITTGGGEAAGGRWQSPNCHYRFRGAPSAGKPLPAAGPSGTGQAPGGAADRDPRRLGPAAHRLPRAAGAAAPLRAAPLSSRRPGASCPPRWRRKGVSPLPGRGAVPEGSGGGGRAEGRRRERRRGVSPPRGTRKGFGVFGRIDVWFSSESGFLPFQPPSAADPLRHHPSSQQLLWFYPKLSSRGRCDWVLMLTAAQYCCS